MASLTESPVKVNSIDDESDKRKRCVSGTSEEEAPESKRAKVVVLEDPEEALAAFRGGS